MPGIVEQPTNSATWNLVFSWPCIQKQCPVRVVPHTRQQESSLSDEEEEEEEIKEEDEVARLSLALVGRYCFVCVMMVVQC